MTRRVCIVTGTHLSRNPRVVKEATALADAGYDVTVLGLAFSEALAEEDRTLAGAARWRHRIVVDLRPSIRRGSRLVHRITRRAAAELVRMAAWQVPEALGYGVRATLRAARAERADLTIGHQEVGLWVARELLRGGMNAGVDLEDWYSRDLRPEDRAGRPVRLLREAEAELLRSASHLTTTSRSMADALVREYGGRRPVVVYNAFPWSDRERLDGRLLDRGASTRPSLHWVSQTIGPDRGLETLLAALASVATPVDVHLRGQGSDSEEERLRALLPPDASHRLFVHPPVSAAELPSRIAEHDIGLALEATTPENKQYTVSNKILHYLLCGLAVVATDTAGQREVATAAPGAIRLCRAGDATGMAAAITDLIGSPSTLANARAAALEAARTTFSWEQQMTLLVDSVARAVGDGRSSTCAVS